MTNAYASMHGRSRASMLDAGAAGTLGRLRDAWTNYATYRKTLAELRKLPARALRDINLDGDLATIARHAVYGR